MHLDTLILIKVKLIIQLIKLIKCEMEKRLHEHWNNQTSQYSNKCYDARRSAYTKLAQPIINTGMAVKIIELKWDRWSVEHVEHVSSSKESEVTTFSPCIFSWVSDLVYVIVSM